LAVACALLAAACVLLFTFDPATAWWFPSCPLHAWTGWLCPLCGSLRAFHALLRGQLRAALELNPLPVVVLSAGFCALAHDVVRPARATWLERCGRLCFSPYALALVAAFGVLRNVSELFHWIAF
jgi:hypothetical protein